MGTDRTVVALANLSNTTGRYFDGTHEARAKPRLTIPRRAGAQEISVERVNLI